RIGKTYSPSLGRICRETNHRSDNFYAETLLRTLGRRTHTVDNYDTCRVALRSVLKDLGVDDTGGLIISDGSGLSRTNSLSPAFMVRFLSAMRRSPAWNDYLAGLPIPGANGTMRTVLPTLPQETKDRIHLKSGSMNGVLCYSGYITRKKGRKKPSTSPSSPTTPTWPPQKCGPSSHRLSHCWRNDYPLNRLRTRAGISATLVTSMPSTFWSRRV
ncbi:MAG: D-alanyl-D-alanine carboxypeptidase, partial [Bacteroidales bacterium]|nr:D-alanyl-D-alanine carboxypeptidase [Bacteroidales bacterium]